jgi:hypothetical protein
MRANSNTFLNMRTTVVYATYTGGFLTLDFRLTFVFIQGHVKKQASKTTQGQGHGYSETSSFWDNYAIPHVFSADRPSKQANIFSKYAIIKCARKDLVTPGNQRVILPEQCLHQHLSVIQSLQFTTNAKKFCPS